MYTEDDLLPLSALQHLLFCERQCGLIHVEQLWADNRLTVEGSHLHRKADEGPRETRGAVRTTRSVPLRSMRLGLIGKADVVELHRSEQSGSITWRPFPVEYKRGRPKRDLSDKVQLCAQALCLEEMQGITIPAGALFYGSTRRRHDVAFDEVLRTATETAARRLHELVRSRVTPRAVRAPKCDSCSLIDLCLPDATCRSRSARRYVEQALHDMERDG
ncbi:CRISPR-associated protein Cas4 [Piscinibacter sp.]|uniref:CRISPR-associated protein Cas4 n=1 Tax=Piscinibacter sp. TaxID=1903157 RepID=UPI002D07E5F8|nr:CRISPR-associated protein Cas4 [Albitalea sp.]HUG26116.1 CRISPR-associated protein Cas4 [Albitalea sp.]